MSEAKGTMGDKKTLVEEGTQFKGSLTAMPDPNELSTKGTIYVPTYSRIYGASSGAKKLIELSTTLRIDNTSNTKPLVIERIDRAEAGRIAETVFMLCLFAGCASLVLGAFAAAFASM